MRAGKAYLLVEPVLPDVPEVPEVLLSEGVEELPDDGVEEPEPVEGVVELEPVDELPELLLDVSLEDVPDVLLLPDGHDELLDEPDGELDEPGVDEVPEVEPELPEEPLVSLGDEPEVEPLLPMLPEDEPPEVELSELPPVDEP